MRGRGKTAGLLAVLAFAATVWAADVCPTCGKRRCPWFKPSSAGKAPQHVLQRLQRPLIESHPAYRAAEKALPKELFLRGQAAATAAIMNAVQRIQESDSFQEDFALRSAADPEYNQYRTKQISRGAQEVESRAKRLREPSANAGPEVQRLLRDSLDGDPALRPLASQANALSLSGSNSGQLLVAVAAGRQALNSPYRAAKLLSGVPFDAAGGDPVREAARALGEVTARAAEKAALSSGRLDNIRQAAETPRTRALLMGSQGDASVRKLISQEGAAASSEHLEARERIKGLVIAPPPAPKPGQGDPQSAKTISEWAKGTADAVKEWTIRVHERYPATDHAP